MTEYLNVDNVIDRLYIKHRNMYEPYQLVDVITDALGTIFTSHNFDRTYVKERIFKILDYQYQLEKLKNIPLVEQRSPEWYSMRQNLITASDFAQALGEGKFGTQKQFFQKKSGYEKDTFDNNNPALKWGVKYEPVAIFAYEKKNKTKMYDFGLLRHPTLHWFGASPDSITELGIMVEIKCPWKRKITGDVPKQYFYQMQGQLDVCQLKECDYLECEFIEYANSEEFSNHFSDNLNEKGVIIEYISNDVTKYAYSEMDICYNLDKCLAWETKTKMEITKQNFPIVKSHYWQLNTFNVVRVYKDNDFLTEKFPLLKDVWEKINAYKRDRSLYEKDIMEIKQGNTTTENIKQAISITTNTRASSKPYEMTSSRNEVKISGFAFVDDD